MKRATIAVLILLLAVSCGKKEENPADVLSKSQIESLQESATLNTENIQYEGTYKGSIKGKKVELKIEDDSFEISENGKQAFGNWLIVDDGTIIELNAKSGTVNNRFYSWSDKDSWMALTDSLTVPEIEEFLKRVPE